MNNSNKHTEETRIALLEQGQLQILEKITDEFMDMKSSLREFSTKSELRMAIQERDSKISEMEIRFAGSVKTLTTDLKELRPRYTRSTILSTVVAVIITFFATYVLKDIFS